MKIHWPFLHPTPARQAYHNSPTYYRDSKSVIDTVFEEGREKERFAIATRMKEAAGRTNDEIALSTELSISETDRL